MEIEQAKPYFLKKLNNFNEIFAKYVIYDNIKSHKKTGFHPLFRRYICGKTTGRWCHIDHPIVLGIM